MHTHSLLIKPFKAQWLLYVPPDLTIKNSLLCPQSAFVLYVSQNKQRLFPYAALTD
jgi:hypothetical protein